MSEVQCNECQVFYPARRMIIMSSGTWCEHCLAKKFPSLAFEHSQQISIVGDNGDSDSVSTCSIRQFDTGATRDQDIDKFDFEGFLSPIVLNRFGQYMHKHRKQSDGKLRDSDNWQKGIPKDAYMKSGWRHFFDWWLEHRGLESREGVEDALCGLMFNAMGYLYEILKKKEGDKK